MNGGRNHISMISDTSQEAEEVLHQLYREMPDWKKIERVFELSTVTFQFALSELRRQQPDLSAHDACLILSARIHGEDLVGAAYKKPPEFFR